LNNIIKTKLLDLRQDNSSGASELLEKVLKIVKLQLDSVQNPIIDIKEDFLELAREIINSRPSMAPLINTIGFLIHDLTIINKNLIKKRLKELEVTSTKRKKDLEKNFDVFLNSRGKKELNIMLISYSSTINKLLLKNRDKKLNLFVLESRPLLEGRRVAEKLSKYFKINLIIDAAMGKFIKHVDLVLVGIDSILKDGSIINKLGTYPLTVLAKANKINVYTVGDSYKYNLRSYYGQEIIIEKKPSNEVYDKKLKDNFEVYNYYFDVTPPEYITGIISDLGILSIENFLANVIDTLPIEWFKYFLPNKSL
jgi:translation initiation factor 2B subunit (eIF-2B alpha/beta/delta family)